MSRSWSPRRRGARSISPPPTPGICTFKRAFTPRPRTRTKRLIPADMVDFLARWPVAREAAETALSFDGRAAHARQCCLCRSAPRSLRAQGEYRLRIPLRPRRTQRLSRLRGAQEEIDGTQGPGRCRILVSHADLHQPQYLRSADPGRGYHLALIIRRSLISNSS